jgi:hypothetical protein
MPKARRTIPEKDVDRIFDADCIRRLASDSNISKDADIEKLGREIREGVRIYAKAAREPSDNELHAEIKALHDASDKNFFERVGGLIEHLSPRARSELLGRWEQRHPGIKFPEPSNFTTADQRKEACSKIASLCRMGGKAADDRMRPSGRRSRTWRVAYYAPKRTRHFPKTFAEDQFVAHLAIAWCDITGKLPPKVTHQENPGPFARLVRECLRLSGSSANAVNLINKYGRLRSKAEARLSGINR